MISYSRQNRLIDINMGMTIDRIFNVIMITLVKSGSTSAIVSTSLSFEGPRYHLVCNRVAVLHLFVTSFNFETISPKRFDKNSPEQCPLTFQPAIRLSCHCYCIFTIISGIPIFSICKHILWFYAITSESESNKRWPKSDNILLHKMHLEIFMLNNIYYLIIHSIKNLKNAWISLLSFLAFCKGRCLSSFLEDSVGWYRSPARHDSETINLALWDDDIEASTNKWLVMTC